MRKFVREQGVPLAEVKGSGLKGRTIDIEVPAFTRSVMSGAVQTRLSPPNNPRSPLLRGVVS